MTVAISQELLTSAEKLAADCGYASVSEYLESLIEDAIAAAELKESIAQMEAGQGRPAKEVFADLAAKYGVELE